MTWSLEDVAKTVKRDSKFVSQVILRANWHELDHRNGGPVRFPKDEPTVKSNGPYRIQARAMCFWIEKNWERIQTAQ
ncbi:hypothetical protein FC18_GL002309 [Lacticaseibacillus sharpeae JCM 1186 = DSM 20505]|uniref:Uncharacterized protein n=1 Tax=Lacticaseibacillus sharpeae JCM 1186 = DSM 20505 TaxID=1291052 RepID=A0A0R1ZSF3_9LACO|nr:hypothetical protein FC18_GL002309 [Lacticaseibacillus sharpeae JCM 1186 = DSM 20505]